MSRPLSRPQSLLSSARTQCLRRKTQAVTTTTIPTTISQQQYRAFTQSRPTAANLNAIQKRHERQQKQMLQGGPPQQSLTVMSKKSAGKNAPNDLGLMLGTLIMPSAEKRPSLFGAPVVRTKLELARLWKRTKDVVSLVATSKFIQKPRGKIHFFKTKTTAMALHRQMYTAFAEGDNLTINSICTEGLRDRFRARIAARKSGDRYIWTLHNYIGTPKVMSHRASVMPVEDALDRKSTIRQAIVRIRSRQSLRKIERSELDLDQNGAEDIKEVTEFVVIQKRVWKGTEEKWKVWGTTEETTMEEMKEALNPTIPDVKL